MDRRAASVAGRKGDYTYGTNRPHAVTAAGENSYGYDASGNQTVRPGQSLVFDVQNRLVEIVDTNNSNATMMEALYGAEGNRILRQLTVTEPVAPDTGETTTTIYLAGYETDIETGDTRIPHSLGGKMVGITINDQLNLTAPDHLGSGNVSLDTVTGESVVQRYTPFGFNRNGENTLGFDQTFTGQTDDPGTGLIDYNARHYDPLLGRFISADPVLDGLNRYTYVHNRPTRMTDPTGHCGEGDPREGARPCTGTNAPRTASTSTEQQCGISSYLCPSDSGDVSPGCTPSYLCAEAPAGQGFLERQWNNFHRGLDNLCVNRGQWASADNGCDSLSEIYPDKSAAVVGAAENFDGLEASTCLLQCIRLGMSSDGVWIGQGSRACVEVPIAQSGC